MFANTPQPFDEGPRTGPIRIFFVGCGAIFGVVAAIALLLGWIGSWTPFLDHGPFHGSPVANCPTHEPDQRFPIWGQMELAVFDPVDSSEAPIVALHEATGDAQWCIQASGHEGTEVKRLRFASYLRVPFVRARVRGRVHWTFGREGMVWLFEPSGELIEYWYSW